MPVQVVGPVVKDAARTSVVPYRPKICMHTLREFRNDVRAMRAAAALTEAGFEVSVVDIEAERTRLTEEVPFRRAPVEVLRHVLVPDWYSARRFEPWFFVKAVQALVVSVFQLMQIRADMYHACDLTALPASFLVATLRRKPLIFEVYDLHFPVPETGVGFWRRLSGLLMRFHAFVLPRCVGVIATSPLHADEICKRFSLPEVVLVRNIPAYRSVEKSNRLRDYLGLGPDVRIALYQGSLQPDRELDRLIRAARFLARDSVIVMMGKDKVGTQARLEELIVSQGVADRVKILAPVPYEELLDWTASADIGVILYSPTYSPNVRMCLPNKLFEFLMAGLPVLAGQLDAISSILKDYDVGRTVSSLEPAAIGEAMNMMLKDRNALERMRGNALQAVLQELNWEEESQKLVDFYADIFARLRAGKSV